MNVSRLTLEDNNKVRQHILESLTPDQITELVDRDMDAMEQAAQRLLRLVGGRLMATLVEVSVLRHVGPPPNCAQCSCPMRLVDRRRERKMHGLVGDFAYSRPYFHCRACGDGQYLNPLDTLLIKLRLSQSHSANSSRCPGAHHPGRRRVACLRARAPLALGHRDAAALRTAQGLLLAGVPPAADRRHSGAGVLGLVGRHPRSTLLSAETPGARLIRGSGTNVAAGRSPTWGICLHWLSGAWLGDSRAGPDRGGTAANPSSHHISRLR